MDFQFAEEQIMLRETIKRFVDAEVRPVAEKIDRESKIPPELVNKARELGLFGVPFPQEYGGVGANEVSYCIVMEELARGSASFATLIGAHASIGAMAIFLDGTEEQKRKYLVPLAGGEKIAAFALTEPNAGSDAAAIETSAARDGDYYAINGNKIFITNGSIADVVTVFAVTDKSLGAKGGVTAFIVESGMKGFKVGKIEEKMGTRGVPTAELVFEDMRVPKENVLGQIGAGFLTAMKTLDIGRLSLAAACLGGAKELLDLSTKYANQRVQFGGPISNQEAIQWMLAAMAADIFAMESMIYRTAWMCDRKEKFTRQAATCKMAASEALDRIADLALQIHGGYGYMSDYPIERLYRDARINRIIEGTNEIQRLVIARDIIKKGGY